MIYKGNDVRVTATFLDLSGNPATPTTITFRLTDPQGNVTTPTATASSVGVYYVDFIGTIAGDWSYTWLATGAVTAERTGQVAIVGGSDPSDLCVLSDVKGYLGMKDSDTSDDLTLQDMITGASAYFMSRTSRGSLNSIVARAERRSGNGKQSMMLRYYPIVSVTSLTISRLAIPLSTDQVASGFYIGDTGDVIHLTGCYDFCRGHQNVAISYLAGYAVTPSDVEAKVIELVAINYRRRKTIDQDEVVMPASGGTTKWRAWETTPQIERVIANYSPGVPI